ncbi:hypothetical protein PACTADRAFT_3762 [Pachysolen tannophilus NRRL Y-2460]|uniref:BAG domain-containing protein n=1 Tax=Pachysolen tannophilus NRRL Y-2460 TaxID=669874 RepID=A0A1E4TT27_PACTA|nr:hypothetical protein PACTADRAFT_3762 [Pachysolen tannophilus NRRL Y-2460]
MSGTDDSHLSNFRRPSRLTYLSTKAQKLDIRAHQRTYQGAYIRSTIGLLSFALLILKLFSEKFLKIGVLYTVYSMILFLISLVRLQNIDLYILKEIQHSNGNVDHYINEGYYDEDTDKVYFKTSGNFVLLISMISNKIDRSFIYRTIQVKVIDQMNNHLEYIISLKDQALVSLNNSIGSNPVFKQLIESIKKYNWDYKLIGISTATIITIMFLINRLFSTESAVKSNSDRGTAGKKKDKKKKKSGNNRSKKKVSSSPQAEEVQKVSPHELASLKIETILKDVRENIIPAFNVFIRKFEEGYFDKFKGNTEGLKKEDDVSYQYLFFNESFLKHLMYLDEVDTLGDSDLRIKRKEAIKFIQKYHKQLDEVKAKI